ncbi:enhanced serine sensitivity protein SseB C-terminal domain-containing protein [Alloalcanivorax marinus]|uniref:enhanced serine sensitivity protein SseB C-terminal domain-containing protein n=1 Tax=Alloalcanivorax marinus TaxID=1177169 RepID=UPI0019322D39|nr:enhanced serine sensitivity protein SseB C-terminal domain-containing protein [Alloalcanivorax marinus]MBL7250179.1 enhanced serine sensitivity protein SseB C-terminal domain-containing protein [Alloalcanivorax marinus]
MPDNPLFESLKRAADDPAARPEFYRRLLTAEIFVIGHGDGSSEGRGTVPAGAHLSIEHWQNAEGEAVIPFFTDLEALQRAIDEEKSYLGLPARSLFEMTAGTRLVLNPRSDYGKEFHPEEVRSLLENGSNHSPETRRTEADTDVLLGQPSEYPTAMVEALQRLLTGYPEVEAAYLCLMQQGGESPQQSLVVGLRGGNLERARLAAGSVIADTAPQGRAVDLIEISSDAQEGGLAGYLRDETTPFHERQQAARTRSDDAPRRPWWRRLFGGG